MRHRVFIRRNPESTFPFATYHVLAILEAMARYAVQQDTYRELVYDFIVDGALVSSGCVTVPEFSRGWCQGLRGEHLQGIQGGKLTAYE